MTIVKKGNYRINTIIRLTSDGGFFEEPISYGLGIERSCGDSKDSSYYVIAFVRYEDDIKIEIVGDRLLDVDTSEFDLFKKMINSASDLVRIANMEDA